MAGKSFLVQMFAKLKLGSIHLIGYACRCRSRLPAAFLAAMMEIATPSRNAAVKLSEADRPAAQVEAHVNLAKL